MCELRQGIQRRRQAQTASRLLVKYCGVDCQRAHRKQHKGDCKQRAAELKDEQLYGQGQERSEDDFCPICSLLIPLPMHEHSGFFACCAKKACHGCGLAAQRRGMLESCPFCRTPDPKDNAPVLAQLQTRTDAKDPVATMFLASQYYYGSYGLEKDVPRAIELYTEAAEGGSAEAHAALGKMYYEGEGVEQNQSKGIGHWELAAMQGNVTARCSLGHHEFDEGNYERALRHYLISAKMGCDDSLKTIKNMFAAGLATREQYAGALRGYQVAVEEMKSPQRDEEARAKANVAT
ncbi:hypothetical protein THAOC_24033 [Thalassiosira oceanica]|uniref:Uncharacterized protein n=1 Tax=Thalassiosira oceanica TaxID=159749 RepID=K0RQU8_THAOC|nr:hypothetical protein THAOC_24033 [Thalassiosira oceanica]|eukprot:EJK56138.1 hypothetical protein THAOC_24033 [Thalassiosira oceanica]